MPVASGVCLALLCIKDQPELGPVLSGLGFSLKRFRDISEFTDKGIRLAVDLLLTGI